MNTADPNAILDAQLSILHELQELLQQEKEAITARNADLVVSLSEKKAKHVEQLQQHDVELAAIRSKKPADTQAESKQQQIAELLEACKVANEINGKAINLSLASLGRLQQQLSRKLGGDSSTYDQSGKSISGRSRGTGLKA